MFVRGIARLQQLQLHNLFASTLGFRLEEPEAAAIDARLPQGMYTLSGRSIDLAADYGNGITTHNWLMLDVNNRIGQSRKRRIV